MRLGAYHFQPTLVPSLFAAIGLAILVTLGLWQLDRASEKQLLIDAQKQRAAASPINLNDSVGYDWPRERYRPVELTGHYDVGHQFLLDNRTHQGRVGFQVLTPFLLDGSERILLVKRGWVAANLRREDLPEIMTPEGQLTLTGQIEMPPEKYFRLGDAEEPGQSGVHVIQEVRLSDIERRLGKTLIPIILLLDAGDESGFVRDWRPVYGISPDKHQAYALQWFSIALILLVIFVVTSSSRSSESN